MLGRASRHRGAQPRKGLYGAHQRRAPPPRSRRPRPPRPPRRAVRRRARSRSRGGKRVSAAEGSTLFEAPAGVHPADGAHDWGSNQENCDWVRRGTLFVGEATAETFELINTKNKKRYLVARDSEEECVCTTHVNRSTSAPRELDRRGHVRAATCGHHQHDVVVIPGLIGTLDDVLGS